MCLVSNAGDYGRLMCLVSNVGDYGRLMWPIPSDPMKTPGIWPPSFQPVNPWVPGPGQTVPIESKPYNGPTKEQFEEFLDLLRAARKFDKATGQADCPTEEKTSWMRDVAKMAGVDPAKVDEILKG